MEFQYKTSATSENGRNGTVTVENSPLTFQMASPLAMGGKDDTGVNPEQLFAAGYSACFGSALQHVIRTKKLHIPLPAVRVTIGIGKNDAGGYALGAQICGIFKNTDQVTAEALMAEAHMVCPYSNATRGNIEIIVSAEIA